jgi:hypothetical protein
MQEHNTTPNNISKRQAKDTNILCFIDAAKYCQPMPKSLVAKLAQKFSVTPEHLVILIEISCKGGALVWN